jgi:rSAM/selenodomain-associated transferase 2
VSITVVIPTYNEEENLRACISSIRSQRQAAEVIVVDGKSKDRTMEIAAGLADQAIPMTAPNISLQLNRGAEASQGDVLLFLHADCILAADLFEQITNFLSKPDHIGGAFKMKLSGPKLFYRLLEAGGDLYCKLSGTYFGDRGIFIRTAVFKEMRGFADLPLMADVEFSRRMKHFGKTRLLKGPLTSSNRKFDRENPLLSLFLISGALLAYRFNVSPEKIGKLYYSEKKG